MSNHTPGPWQAVGTKVFGLDAVVAIKQDHPRHFICSIPRVKPTASPPANPDQEANARLIAASPEMLDALKLVYDRCVSNAGSDDPQFYPPDEHVMTKVVNAIAKAEGRS